MNDNDTKSAFRGELARRLYERHAAANGVRAAEWATLAPAARTVWLELAAVAAAFVGDVADECVSLAARLLGERTPVRLERGEYDATGNAEVVCARADYHMAFGATSAEALYDLRGALLQRAGEDVRVGARAARAIKEMVKGGGNGRLLAGSRRRRRRGVGAPSRLRRPRRMGFWRVVERQEATHGRGCRASDSTRRGAKPSGGACYPVLRGGLYVGRAGRRGD